MKCTSMTARFSKDVTERRSNEVLPYPTRPTDAAIYIVFLERLSHQQTRGTQARINTIGVAANLAVSIV